MGFLGAAHRGLTVDGQVGTVTETRGASTDVVYVLCLMQGAFLLLAGLGEVLLMGGNPLYLILPVGKLVLLCVFASHLAKRWGLVGILVLQAITLAGYWIQLLVGLLVPALDFTMNLVGLMTNLAMPVAIILICAPALTRQPVVVR
jgi:hypothetical protein